MTVGPKISACHDGSGRRKEEETKEPLSRAESLLVRLNDEEEEYIPKVPLLVEDCCLQDWKVIGSGGFGQIYRARHRQWGCDVAVKLLRCDNGTSAAMLREIDMMRLGSSPHVILVRGVFKGRVPPSSYTQLGLVMEFMERGSLTTVQDRLHETLPWPLVFRLAHQVALGVSFLHSLTPALLHLDLKPGNVLLDNDLNAKLTDFGLSRFYHSVSRCSQKSDDEKGGTLSYMPPEAFHLTYKPTQAFDIYSYGILLWSIATGTKPYAYAKSSLVRFRIPEGDRPPLDEIRLQAAGLAGLTRLIALIERCWDTKPELRPFALECTTEAEELYKMHKLYITDAVHQVLKKLDQNEEELMIEQFQRVLTPVSVSEGEEAKIRNTVLTGGPPIQEMADIGSTNRRDVARAKDRPSSRPSSGCYDDVSRQSTNNTVNRSSVCPIQSSPSSPSTGRSQQGRAAKPSQHGFENFRSSQYQRQVSSPEASTTAGGVNITLSNVTGFQYGNNNTMHLQVRDHSGRKRHPTAPPRVDLQGSSKDKTGGAH